MAQPVPSVAPTRRLDQPLARPDQPLDQPLARPDQPLDQPPARPDQPLDQPPARPARALTQEHGRPALALVRASGLVRRASERDGTVESMLPVAPALRPLFPRSGLRRGSTVAVAAGPGATSLLLALLAPASAAGSWCAVVGLPGLGLVAAAEAGLALDRLALVPQSGPDWARPVAALIDGFDVVVVAIGASPTAQVAMRLAARARQRGCVLVPFTPAGAAGRWPGPDLTLQVVAGAWHGLGQGRGRLRAREVEVAASGRGASARTRQVYLWLPGAAEEGGDHADAAVVVPRLAGDRGGDRRWRAGA